MAPSDPRGLAQRQAAPRRLGGVRRDSLAARRPLI